MPRLQGLHFIAVAHRGALVVISLILLLASGVFKNAFGQVNPANFITIREKAGVTTQKYPLQIGRPFLPGEILNFPQAVLNGARLTTQADVKSRWPDGSVKHAILTFYLPTIAANTTITVTFANQTTGNNTNFLTKPQMLNAKFNFNASTELTNGTTATASARTMLEAGKFEYWHKGAVTTSIILADHSLERAFDIGFDTHRSFRPLYHATFWPGINKVRVRFIGEVANTVALQDLSYALTLKLGWLLPQTVYTKPAISHHAASRWTKEFWIGGAPPLIEINHNLAYLKQTRALPNYDTSRRVSEAALNLAYTAEVNGWASAQKDLFDAGNLMKLMPSAGGRDEIGPYPTWLVLWLYTGDRRMHEKTFGNAELSAAFPIHFREGLGTRQFDRNGPSALGKVLSLTARPTVVLHAGNYYINYLYTEAADKIVPVGTMTDNGWVADVAHQPDYFSPLYLLTGDYFYLEEMYFWAAWSAASTNFTNAYHYGRGPTGDTGGIHDEVRGDAWTLRNRVQTAFCAPDGTPEKDYFTRLTNDAIAIWEGTLSITGTTFEGNANWNWGNTKAVLKYGSHGVPVVPALHFWDEGSHVPSWSTDVDPGQATNRTQPWMIYFLIYAFGRAKELGYPTGPLLAWTAPVVINQLTNPDYNPYLSASFMMPTVQASDNKYFGNWLAERGGFRASYDAQQDFSSHLNDANHGYTMICMTAAAMAARESGGGPAWAFIQQYVLPATSLNDNPKWAILPR
jgi:hypothetical protein